MGAPAWSPSESNLHKVTLIFMLVKETTGETNVSNFTNFHNDMLGTNLWYRITILVGKYMR